MGLLSANQKTQMETKNFRIRQTWSLWTPSIDDGPKDNEIVLHDGVDIKRIIDAGSRTVEGYNQAVARRGKLASGQYSFSLDNLDEYLTVGKINSVWYRPESVTYTLKPQECDIEHRIYLWMDTITIPVWDELDFMAYRGKIDSFSYVTGANAQGDSVAYEMKINCVNNTIAAIIDRAIVSSDGTTTSGLHFFTGE